MLLLLLLESVNGRRRLCLQVTLKINEIGRIALRDFKGLESCDSATRQMVLDFSLNVAQGHMDQAFR